MENRQLTTKLAYPASEAIHLLLHHVHGGLHNAAMALQLSTEGALDTAAQDRDGALVVQSGLEGIARAARGLSFLTVALGLGADGGHVHADREWVALVDELLRKRARERGVGIAWADGSLTGGPEIDAERLAAKLLGGIVAIDEAVAGSRVRLPDVVAA